MLILLSRKWILLFYFTKQTRYKDITFAYKNWSLLKIVGNRVLPFFGWMIFFFVFEIIFKEEISFVWNIPTKIFRESQFFVLFSSFFYFWEFNNLVLYPGYFSYLHWKILKENHCGRIWYESELLIVRCYSMVWK